MFSTPQSLERRTGQTGLRRYDYLKELIAELNATESDEYKEQILANLANFAYDPINYEYFRRLDVVDIFLNVITNTQSLNNENNVKKVGFAISGICNLCLDEKNKEYLLNKSNLVHSLRSILITTTTTTTTFSVDDTILVNTLTTLIFLNNDMLKNELQNDFTLVGIIKNMTASKNKCLSNIAVISLIFILWIYSLLFFTLLCLDMLELESEISLLKSKNLINYIPNHLYNHFKIDYNERILKQLTASLDEIIENDHCTSRNVIEVSRAVLSSFQSYFKNIKDILNVFEKQKNLYNLINMPTNEELFVYQRAILIQFFTTEHYDLINLLFQKVFDIYHAANNDEDEDNLTEDENSCFTDSCKLCNSSKDSDCKCNLLTDNLHSLNRILFELQLFDHLCGDIIVEVVQNKIKAHIENVSLDNYHLTFINNFEKWLDNIIIGWIRLIYSSSNCAASDNEIHGSFDTYLFNYKKQLAHFMYTHYAHTRINRLFDIIVDYPDSKNAIEDLKVCLQKTNLRSTVTKSLKSSIEQRLLHPGVNTSDILTAYVSAIKALIVLDSSGVMMENVCEPLKRYLRNREDTVKCIVSNLIDETSSDLMEEFCKDVPEEGNSNLAGSSEVDKDWRTWMPDPIDANPVTFTHENSKPDIISMLVNIYGSKDMFVNEYKTLLGDRLLSSYTYNMEKEIRYLELLKLRFGDSNLFCCEAMLRDISESKRINTNVVEQMHQKGKNDKDYKFDKTQLDLKCIILSEQFWPKLKDETIELPNEIKQIQEKYTKSYEALKGNRTLLWKNNLGQVKIDIEVNNNAVEFNVTPIQAAVIMKFQEKDTWTLQELSQSLKMCSIGLRKKLGFWKSQGLIRDEIQSTTASDGTTQETTEIYSVVKDTVKLNRTNSFNEDEEDENGEQKSQANNLLKEQEIPLLWNYTQSMLRGFGVLPFERIHALLKMYATSDIKSEQVKALLDLKVKESLLKYNAGVYRLNK